MNRERKPPGRQIFVLTPKEKKTLAFVLCAVVLGWATKHYRDAHPRPLPAPLAKSQKAKPSHLNRTSPPPASAELGEQEQERK